MVATPAPAAPEPIAANPVEAAQPPAPVAPPAEVTAAQPVQPVVSEAPSGSFYTPQQDEAFAAVQPQQSSEPVSWTAAEFVAHHKTSSWYLILAAGAALLAVVVWFLFKDLFSSVVVVIVALLFGVYAGRAPRELHYTLDNRGIGIGNKFRSYGEFRSFSVAEDGPAPNIVFMPLKRFGMVATIYYDQANEDAIVNTLSAHLPFAEHVRDPIDALMHRIRF